MAGNKPTALERFNEYYSIQDSLPMTVCALPDSQTTPTWEAFEQEVPDVFKLASELHSFDTETHNALRRLGELGELIHTILHQQNTKLNALLGYVLRNEDHPEQRQSTLAFGAGGVQYMDNQATFELGQPLLLKLFIPASTQHSMAAIYSYAEVAAIEESDQGRIITLAFTRIREDDRELLVRASLHAQTRLLKKRAENREE
ncbi:hypothetical protein CWE15_04275 [Aliidiomarina taiwanensis]|uniref:PilZ domain-containing protein n=1 Tax=Aliidiomarina taiwanensis TaxID=946228 RepID=A0A432XAI5_9GAMM|nr:PilZ domain-containing protein [Aliidiomarina taiwanensis]RUO44397.1 hypothetical protein CWE15_04275 [Aliidiomarina taiwanensis]